MLTNPIAIKEHDYSFIFDPKNAESIVALAPSKLAKAVECVPSGFLEMDREELEAEVNPTKTDKAIKIAFWREYNRSRLTGTHISMRGIANGICHESYINHKFLPSSKKIAWMLQANIADEIGMQIMYEKSMDRLDEILNSNMTDKNGNLDARRAEVVLKAIQLIENRVKGLAIQRTESKNLNVKIEEKTDGSKDREEIISGLRERLGKLEGLNNKGVTTT